MKLGGAALGLVATILLGGCSTVRAAGTDVTDIALTARRHPERAALSPDRPPRPPGIPLDGPPRPVGGAAPPVQIVTTSRALGRSPASQPVAGADPTPQGAPAPAEVAAQRDARLREQRRAQVRTMPIRVAWGDGLAWGSKNRVELIIASASLAAAEQEVRRIGRGLAADEAPIGLSMRATLEGDGVTIEEPRSVVRPVTGLSNTTIAWNVEPTRPGKAHLVLRVFNQVHDGENVFEEERPAYETDLEVRIAWTDWLLWKAAGLEPVQAVIWGGLTTAAGVVAWILRQLGLWDRLLGRLLLWRDGWRRRVAAIKPAEPPVGEAPADAAPPRPVSSGN